MKYFIFPITIIMILSIYSSITNVESANNTKLDMMAKVIQENSYEVKEWGIFTRDPMVKIRTKEEFHVILNKFKRSRAGYKWSVVSDVNHHLKVVGVYEDIQGQVTYRIILTAIKEFGQYRVEAAYEVKGTDWDLKKMNRILENPEYKTNEDYSFYSIRGEMTKENINKEGLTTEAGRIMDQFSAKEVEKLVEDNFISLSALTNSWENPIKFEENKMMNLQIAMRYNANDEKLNITIGTPILTAEY